jgi:hypothetical protein
MTAADQLHMFEPEGAKLAEIIRHATRSANHERSIAANLQMHGYLSAARTSAIAAIELDARAAQCEMALQFEQLADLA